MDLNFGMIFLCLAIGAVIGFEFGRSMAFLKIRVFFEKLSADMREAEQKKKEEAEQKKKEAKERWEHLKELLDKTKPIERTDEENEE